MSSREMAAWCPEHRVLGPAELPDHRLAFLRRSIRWGAGAADIVPAPGRSVWGVVYELPLGLGDLDAKEGEGSFYRRRELEVLLDGSALGALAYEVIRKEPAELTPTRDYLDVLVSGATEHGLPGHYVAGLRALVHLGEWVVGQFEKLRRRRMLRARDERAA
jgi:gamma-glutamylcyclotransferase